MKSSGRRFRIQWGHLILLAVIVLVTVAYLLDARGTSLNTNNLLLVQPASIIALILAALVLPQVFKRGTDEMDEDAADRRARWGELGQVASLAGAFGVFVFSLETIGFDVATFVFTSVGLYVCGERRIWLILSYSAVFTVLIVYGYQMLVTYPFPLSVL